MNKKMTAVLVAALGIAGGTAYSQRPSGDQEPSLEDQVRDGRDKISASIATSREILAKTPRPAPLELYKEYPDMSKGVDENGRSIAEKEEFLSLGNKIQQIQRKLQADHHAPQIVRGFHAKSIGCLRGELRVLDERPADARYGLFAETKSWPIWVRFSDGVGFAQGDKAHDVRGMAIKVMGVPGKKLQDDEQGTQDFVMTNFPLPLGKDAQEFMEFAQANATGKLALAEFMATHPKVGKLLLEIGTHRVDSIQNEQFWSGSPYHLGPAGQDAKAIKFSVKPCQKKEGKSPRKGDDFLRGNLQSQIDSSDVCFDFLVQFQKDPVKQPIEDTSVDWDKTASFVRVAQVVLKSKQVFGSERQQRFCDDLSFNPWHSLPEHKPLGNMNRARKIVYEFSKSIRPRETAWEPTGNEDFSGPPQP